MMRKLEKFSNYILSLLFISLIFSTTISRGLSILLIFMWISLVFLKKQSNIFKSSLSIIVLLFILVRLLCIPFSIDFTLSLEGARKVFFYLVFFVCLDILKIGDKKVLKRKLSLFFYSAVIAAIYGIIKYLLGLEVRITSTTSGCSTLAMFLTAIFGPLLYLGHNRQWFSNRFLWWGGVGFIFLGIILTFGRTHWLITWFFILIIGLRYERKAFFLLSIFSLFLFLFFTPFKERIMTLQEPWQNSGGRDILWKDAISKIEARPIFGWGLNSFKKVFQNKLDVSTWHNDFIQVYMESGILGLLGFLFLFGNIFIIFFKLKNIKDPFYKDLVCALEFSFLSFFLTCFFGGFLLDPINSVQFFIYAGLLARLELKFKNEDINNPDKKTW